MFLAVYCLRLYSFRKFHIQVVLYRRLFIDEKIWIVWCSIDWWLKKLTIVWWEIMWLAVNSFQCSFFHILVDHRVLFTESSTVSSSGTYSLVISFQFLLSQWPFTSMMISLTNFFLSGCCIALWKYILSSSTLEAKAIVSVISSFME